MSYGILVAGGSSLLLLGLISRPTADLDVIGLATPGNATPGDYVKADRIPPALAEAVRDVATVLELAPAWLNNGPASLMDLGLPEGYADHGAFESEMRAALADLARSPGHGADD